MTSRLTTAIVQWTLYVLAWVATVGTVASLLGRLHWALDAFSLLHLHFLVLLLIALPGVWLADRRRRFATAVVPALLVNLYLVAPFFVGGQPADAAAAPTHSEPLRVMAMNISTSDEGYPQVIELLRLRQPDIVFLSEVRNDLVALMQAELADLYPVQYAEPSRFTLGLAILARDPAVAVQTVPTGADEGRMRRRYLRADFMWQGAPVTLAGIHPLPPIRGDWAASRDRELALMADLAQDVEQPFILIGDLNAAPWSHAMRALTAEAGLRYASDGYGIWPTWFLHGIPVGPLDHALISADWVVEGYSQAGDIGSDHVPLQADLRLRSTMSPGR